MNYLKLDLPLLVLGVGFLLISRLFSPGFKFQAYCQMVSTFWAHQPFVISFSLNRIAPFFAASQQGKAVIPEMRKWIPAFTYIIISSAILSFYWDIPSGTKLFYGQLRILVQMAVFIALGLSALALAKAFLENRGVLFFQNALTATVLLHGLASLYEFMAIKRGWPVIGISRPDLSPLGVAAFSMGSTEVLRPGGLAGEPKTVAVLYGIFVLPAIFAPPPKSRSKLVRALRWMAILLSGLGFLMAFSTSAFIGGVVVVGVLAIRFWKAGMGQWAKGFAVAMFAVAAWGALAPNLSETVPLIEILKGRTIDRLSGGKGLSDPPVQASIEVMRENPRIFLFGTGLGGSSFEIMKHLGPYSYAYAPNIGMVFMLVEVGLLGTLLLLLPWSLMSLLPMPPVTHPAHQKCRYLYGLSVSALILDLAGSGIAMGYPLAIASMAAYAHFSGLANRDLRAGVAHGIKGQPSNIVKQ